MPCTGLPAREVRQGQSHTNCQCDRLPNSDFMPHQAPKGKALGPGRTSTNSRPNPPRDPPGLLPRPIPNTGKSSPPPFARDFLRHSGRLSTSAGLGEPSSPRPAPFRRGYRQSQPRRAKNSAPTPTTPHHPLIRARRHAAPKDKADLSPSSNFSICEIHERSRPRQVPPPRPLTA